MGEPATSFSAVSFGAVLARRRQELGLPQDKVAEAVGISRVQLQNIEAGWSDRARRSPANPRLSTLIGLCRELGGRMVIDMSAPPGW